MRLGWRRLAWLGWCVALVCSPAAAQLREIKLQPPNRDFGFVVGDLVVLQATISTGPDTLLDRQSLPVPGPVGESIELREVGVTEARAGDGHIFTVRTTYQVFLAAERVTQAAVPGYALRFSRGATGYAAQVPEWLFHVSPLRMVLSTDDDLADLRGDHRVSALDEAPARQRFTASIVIAALAFVAFCGLRGWLPGLVGARRKPFAAAMARIAEAGEDRTAAFRALHAAFDITAGWRVFAGDLERFFDTYPGFAEARAGIVGFFAASDRVFFAAAGQDADDARPDLRALARQLRRIERRW